MTAVRWYYWIMLPIFVGAAILAFVFGRRPPGGIAGEIQTDLEALDARAKAKHQAAIVGAARAAEEIERTYQDRITQLNQEERDEVARLRADPVGLADFLVRVGRRGSP